MITIEISANEGFFKYNGVDYPKGHFSLKYDGDLTDDTPSGRNFSLFNIYTLKKLISSRHYSEVTGVTSWDELSELISTLEILQTPLNSDSAPLDVVLQSSTSPLVIIKATELKGETTLTVEAIEDTYVFNVADTSGAVIDEIMTLYSVNENRVSFFVIKEINVNAITVDSLIDYAYEIGDFVQFGSQNMAVDGSVTPRIFGIRNPTAQDIELAVDFTRMILTMQLTSAGDYDEFGNIPELEKGLLCRFVDGEKRNIFNVKNNRDFDNLMYDFKFIDSLGQSPNGLSGRFTFEKLGSVIRLKPFEDLQFVVEDDLTNITLFEILLEGAGVTD